MRTLLLVLSSLVLVTPLVGQRDSLLGQRVWVRNQVYHKLDKGIKGVVEEVKGDTLAVRTSALRLCRPETLHCERRGDRRHWRHSPGAARQRDLSLASLQGELGEDPGRGWRGCRNGAGDGGDQRFQAHSRGVEAGPGFRAGGCDHPPVARWTSRGRIERSAMTRHPLDASRGI